MIGEINKNEKAYSLYQPSKEVLDLTAYVKKDYAQGEKINRRTWVELNNRSPLDDQDRGKRTFNAFVDENIEDPATAWQWRGTRSKARNQAIAMHAQLTSGYVVPNYLAQNDQDEEDQDFSEVMQAVVEWMLQNSNYRDAYVQAAMGMLVNPVTYLTADFAEVFQKIKERQEDGSIVTTEILDEVLSGFKADVLTSEQVLISNAYEQNIQKHRFNIVRHFVEYGELEGEYGHHKNWAFVQPGVKAIYSPDDGMFYDVKDDEHPTLVEKVIYRNRRDDTEVCFINGIYFGEDDVNANPIRHRDNRNAPKYPLVPFGYQRINEHFFFFKSLMAAQYWDNQLLDAQYQIGMNRAFLDANMPVAISGTDQVDSDVIFPSSVVAFEDPNTKVQPLLPQANLGGMFTAMTKVEQSMEESSISAVTAGQLPQATQKATSVAIAQRNAETMIKGVGKTLAHSIVQYGDLLKDIAIQHIVTPQVEEILAGNIKLRYNTLTLDKKVVNGKELAKTIRFDEALLGRAMTERQKKDAALDLLKESGYPKRGKAIYRVNPQLFSRYKYLTKVEPERMFPENEEFRQAMLSQLYAQFANNPYIELEELTRKTLYSYFRSETEDLIKEPEQPALAAAGASAPPQTVFGQQAQNTATASAVPSVGRS
jgi:hypothetical protein